MKKLLIFTIVLLGSYLSANSCGYSPYGEDIRYSMFLPGYFNYPDFKAFDYNSKLFGFNFEEVDQYESNVYDWYEFTKKEVSVEEIDMCLNSLTYSEINPNSGNEFIQYLFKNNLDNVVHYLEVAKLCEAYNSSYSDDPWERTKSSKLNYSRFLSELNNLTSEEKSDYLKRKYAFLTIRTAYYGRNFKMISTLFDKYFARGVKDYLYYWALFFNSFTQKDVSIDVANIMVNSPEKRYAAYYYFHNDFNLTKALCYAKTRTDIANLYAFASIQRLEPNLDYLRKIYENTNKSRILDFLILREINKIEDWVYTPYYTNYLPSTEFSAYWWKHNKNEVLSTETLRARSEKDRLYAGKVLNFINNADFAKIRDVTLWKAAQIQLLFITRNYKECLRKIDDFKKCNSNEKIADQIEKIKVLCLISDQKSGKAIIPEEAKTLILKYCNDNHFLFSVGRELEFRGNLPDGLALIAYGNLKMANEIEYFTNNNVEWQGNRLRRSGNLEYFYEYFDYVDFVYGAEELQSVINKLNVKMDEFSAEIYSRLLKDKNYLVDLLGTKYIRENKLQQALKTFKSMDQKYWEDNYNGWERDRYDETYTFDQNPFFDLKYTFPFIPHADIFLVTKLSVTEHLVKYLELANDPQTKNRDYYYFIIGNCYQNMTQNGHSWMMRRFSSSSDNCNVVNESYIDEYEYRNGQLAQEYYHQAFIHAKTDKFKALCLRMEDYATDNIESKYVRLKTYFPEYYEDLSNCLMLEAYFNEKR